MKIYVIATASLRNAINKEKFIKECKKHTELLISVISGETEANLIYEGVSNNIKKIKNFVIVDIGGASTEFIVVKNKKAVFKKSYPFGSQSLVQKFKPSDPIIEEEIEIIKTYFKNNLTDLIQSLRKYKVKIFWDHPAHSTVSLIFKIIILLQKVIKALILIFTKKIFRKKY